MTRWVWRQLRRVLVGCAVLAVVLAVVGVVRLLAAPVAIRLKATPQSAFTGTTFKFEIRLLPEAGDRWIALAFDPDIVGNGAWTIAGADAYPVYQMTRRLTEPGEYHVVAAVGSGERPRAVSTLTLTVVE